MNRGVGGQTAQQPRYCRRGRHRRYLVSNNNASSEMSPITSAMHHVSSPSLACPGGPAVVPESTLIRMHVSRRRQPRMAPGPRDLCFIFAVVHHSAVIAGARHSPRRGCRRGAQGGDGTAYLIRPPCLSPVSGTRPPSWCSDPNPPTWRETDW